VNVKELIGEVRQRLPMEIRDVLHFVREKSFNKCLLFPELDAEEKEERIQVDENTYVLINHDFEEFSVVCQEKSVIIPVSSIIYVLLADKDKLYVADLDVVEAT
jgi:hypothetical protein